jgi:hypothetical protein
MWRFLAKYVGDVDVDELLSLIQLHSFFSFLLILVLCVLPYRPPARKQGGAI